MVDGDYCKIDLLLRLQCAEEDGSEDEDSDDSQHSKLEVWRNNRN